MADFVRLTPAVLQLRHISIEQNAPGVRKIERLQTKLCDRFLQKGWALEHLLPGDFHAAEDFAHEPMICRAVELPVELQQIANDAQIDGRLGIAESADDLFDLLVDVRDCAWTERDIPHARARSARS